MPRQGERFRTPKEWREMRRRMNLWRKIENASYQLALHAQINNLRYQDSRALPA